MPKTGMKIQAVNFKTYSKPRTHVPVATTSLHYCLKNGYCWLEMVRHLLYFQELYSKMLQ